MRVDKEATRRARQRQDIGILRLERLFGFTPAAASAMLAYRIMSKESHAKRKRRRKLARASRRRNRA